MFIKEQDNRLFLQHGPINIVLEAQGIDRSLAYTYAKKYFETLLDELVLDQQLLKKKVVLNRKFNNKISQSMQNATEKFYPDFITPMAAVAGSVADTSINGAGEAFGTEGLFKAITARGHVTFVLLLFLQRWRRRWFVLQQGKLPRQYLLNYFTDETKKRLKGSIALDECEQVRHDHSVRKSTQKSLILQRLFPQLNPNSPTPKSNHKYYLK